MAKSKRILQHATETSKNTTIYQTMRTCKAR